MKKDTGSHYRKREIIKERFSSLSAFFSWLLILSLGLLALFTTFTLPHLINPSLKIGDIAEKDIRARQTISIDDQNATHIAQEEAKYSALPIFRQDTSQDDAFLNEVKEILNTIQMLQESGITPVATNLTAENHLELLLRANDSNLPSFNLNKHNFLLIKKQQEEFKKFSLRHPSVNSNEIYIALSVEPRHCPNFANKIIASSKRICRVLKRFPTDDILSWQESTIELLPDELSPQLKNKLAALISPALKPNYLVDEEATHRKGDELAASVTPHTKTIEVGELILKKGELVTQENLPVLNAAGTVIEIRWTLVVSLVLIILISVTIVGLYLYIWERQYFFSPASLGLMFTVAVFTSAVAIAIGKHYPQFVPLPSAALILTIFFGRRLAFTITFPILLLLVIDQIIDFNNIVALCTASGAAIGTYSKQRHDLVLTGFIIGMMQALGFIASLAIVPTVNTATLLGKLSTLEFLGGVTSAIISIGCLPFLENMFGVLTPFRLAELTNADQPLLRKLEEDAPGTYQHSLAVANLAEAGARAIKADTNLVRAGALYHDIGKTARPKYFIENQLGDKNPHDSLPPEESRKRVLAHVTDGLMLAKQYALPKAVQDFIPMHQGTSLMAYFYHKACLRDGVDKVDPAFYRYPGPRPRSKETAIVMLADVSEAVTHSMTDASQPEVDEALSKVFENRWQDGQFDESTLTYNELQAVKTAFLRVWRTLHHERLKYPTTTSGRMPIPPNLIGTDLSAHSLEREK